MSEIETQPELEAKVESEPAPVDPALVEKLASCRALVTIDNLLSNCLFPGGAAGDLLGAKTFLQKLHAPIMKECETHPDFARATKPTPAALPPTPPTRGETEALEKAALKRSRKAKAN